LSLRETTDKQPECSCGATATSSSFARISAAMIHDHDRVSFIVTAGLNLEPTSNMLAPHQFGPEAAKPIAPSPILRWSRPPVMAEGAVGPISQA
jgi:hypothetical protein